MFGKFRDSLPAKIAVLLGLMLLLCLPLAQIGALIEARAGSQQQAAAELRQTYAGEQRLVGPVLVVPLVERWSEEVRGEAGEVRQRIARSKERVHLVFPDTLSLEGTLAPQSRYRGIFEVMFYTLKGRAQGQFAPFDAALIAATEKGGTLELRTPMLALGVDDPRGIEGMPVLTLADTTLGFLPRVPGLPDDAWLGRGIHAPLAGAALAAWNRREPLPFSLDLALVGQERLSVAPVAGETTVHLTSPWAHPSFGGRFLAAERTVTPEGFDAHWRVSSLVSSARQQVLASVADKDARAQGLDTFDVTLVQPLNVYVMATRAIKYGALFVALTLLATFMFEIFRKLPLHPVQYGLVGLSLALFFLLLVALSEKLVFWQAYVLAGSASVLLLGIYFSAVLGGVARGISLAGYVAVLYGALYGLLASEDNALMLGALLLFCMVGTLMLATRRVNWYALSAGRTR